MGNYARLITLQDNTEGFARAVELLTKQKVLVGVPSTTAGRPGGKNVNAITNAVLGYIHEFGAPAANIPARPHLVPGVESIRPLMIRLLRVAGNRALSGDPSGAEQVLNQVGMAAQSAVRRKITLGPFVPLAEATIKARQRRGVTRINPLMDTGKYRQSITYVIRII